MRCHLAALVIALVAADDTEPRKMAMTPAVVCSKIVGYGDYEPLPDPSLTRDEKLLLYFEPSGHAYELVRKEYRVHLVEDARIRRRGEKAVLQSKDRLVEYKGRSKTPPLNLYLENSIALKPLPPGEYDLEIILRDEIAKGEPARQVVKFRVIEAKPEDEAGKGGEGEGKERRREHKAQGTRRL